MASDRRRMYSNDVETMTMMVSELSGAISERLNDTVAVTMSTPLARPDRFPFVRTSDNIFQSTIFYLASCQC